MIGSLCSSSKKQTYTESPFMNISGLSLIKLVRTQHSKSLIVNWHVWKRKKVNT